jgi:hypothetical protein
VSAQLAYADVVVTRNSIRNPLVRRGIRAQLYDKLCEMGTVVEVRRYIRDPMDEFVEKAWPDLDRDVFTVVRCEALVRPLHGQGEVN